MNEPVTADDTRVCAFCGAEGAEAVHCEEDYPMMPCCMDEDACHARVLES